MVVVGSNLPQYTHALWKSLDPHSCSVMTSRAWTMCIRGGWSMACDSLCLAYEAYSSRERRLDAHGTSDEDTWPRETASTAASSVMLSLEHDRDVNSRIKVGTCRTASSGNLFENTLRAPRMTLLGSVPMCLSMASRSVAASPDDLSS